MSDGDEFTKKHLFSMPYYTGGKDASGHSFVCLNLACWTSLLHDVQNSDRKYFSEAKWTGNIATEVHELQPVVSC